jgi:hypothetical protein
VSELYPAPRPCRSNNLTPSTHVNGKG